MKEIKLMEILKTELRLLRREEEEKEEELRLLMKEEEEEKEIKVKKEKEEKSGEKEKKVDREEGSRRKNEEDEVRVWHVSVDSAESIWKQIWKDLDDAVKKANGKRRDGLVKLIDPEHPSIKLRRTFLEWGTRHEDIAQRGPMVIKPMITECRDSIDVKLIGRVDTSKPTMSMVQTFEEGYKDLKEAEEDTDHVIFSVITSYSKGNTSQARDCLNKLFLTPMETRWLNLFVNAKMGEEKKEVNWPMETHVGLYHPRLFREWLGRKRILEGEKVMSLKDQARKLIQKRINKRISPYQTACPCVLWV